MEANAGDRVRSRSPAAPDGGRNASRLLTFFAGHAGRLGTRKGQEPRRDVRRRGRGPVAAPDPAGSCLKNWSDPANGKCACGATAKWAWEWEGRCGGG